jgi:hypothetical protein
VLALARAALLDAAEGHQTDEHTEDGERSDDDAALSAGGQRLPVVADAGRVLDLLKHLGLLLGSKLHVSLRSLWDEWAVTYSMILTFSYEPLASMFSQLYSAPCV